MTSRNYCFTINNPTEEDDLALDDLKTRCSYLVYGREKGKEGTPHYQGYCVLLSPSRSTALSKLLPRAHIEVRKGNHKQAQDYCKKDGDYVEHNPKIEKPPSAHAEALSAESYEDACLILETRAPRDWLINGEKIRENLKRKFIPQYPPYVPIFDVQEFKSTPELDLWVQSWQTSRTKCLFLIGPTRLGKTAWARSLVQPHTYWKSMVNLDEFDPASKLIIFDDFDWTYMPNPKGWLTQAGQCTVTDKYRHKRTVSITMPAIYICNEWPVWSGSPDQQYWLSNGVFIEITNKLY